jgi:hypothetical protein
VPSSAAPEQVAFAIEVIAQLLASPRTRSELAPHAIETLHRLGVTPRVARAALRLTGRARPAPPGIGPAGRVVREAEPAQRAGYLVNAALRLQAGLDTPGVGYSGAMRRERRYLILHRDAIKARDHAAALVDRAAARHGPLLRWWARLDARTTAGCRAMHGRTFDVRDPPVLYGQVALPGTTHSGFCRCRAIRAHGRGREQPDRKAQRTARREARRRNR